MNAPGFVVSAFAATLLATTAFALPSEVQAGESRYVGAYVPVGYGRHDRHGDRRHWDGRRNHTYQPYYSHRHRPVTRYYPAPHHHHYHYRPYYGPRYYPYGGSGWHIDLHYRFSGH